MRLNYLNKTWVWREYVANIYWGIHLTAIGEMPDKAFECKYNISLIEFYRNQLW